MTVRFNNNTNALGSDITLNSQGSPRVSQRRAALFSVRGGGEKGTEKKIEIIYLLPPKISSRFRNQARVPVWCCNYCLLSQPDLSNPLGSLQTS